MTAFQQRLVEVMNAYGVANVSRLADMLGYSRSEKVRRVVSGESLPSFGMLVDIATTFAFLNMRWLLTGEGEMLPPGAQKVIDGSRKNLDKLEAIAGPPEWAKEMQARIAQLEAAQKGATSGKNKKAG